MKVNKKQKSVSFFFDLSDIFFSFLSFFLLGRKKRKRTFSIFAGKPVKNEATAHRNSFSQSTDIT